VLIINPFSPESERIVKKHQGEKILSREIFEHAKRILDWKKPGTKKNVLPKTLLEFRDEEVDVLAQRLIFLATALHFTPYSNELRILKERLGALIKARLTSKIGELTQGEIVGVILDRFNVIVGTPTVDGGMRFGEVFVNKNELFANSQLRGLGDFWKVKYVVNWRELVRIIRARELRFTDLYIVDGFALLSLNDLIDYYSILLSIDIGDFVNGRFEEFQKKRTSETIKKLADETSELGNFLTELAGKSYKSTILQGKAGRLREENFPPCIKYIIAGVETGSRNYSISVLLTSFLSYARAAPQKVQNPKLSDYIKDPKVVSEELIVMIYEAAARCTPPLFADQPGEKLNINYHLGLGLTSQPRLENSGNSNWYFPPNCEKIRREAPGLCRPDDKCRQIRNPLTYYFSKSKDKNKGTGEEE